MISIIGANPSPSLKRNTNENSLTALALEKLPSVVDKPQNLNIYKFNIISSLKSLWNIVISFFDSCLHIFKARVEPAAAAAPGLKQELKVATDRPQIVGLEQRRNPSVYKDPFEQLFGASFINDKNILEKERIIKVLSLKTNSRALDISFTSHNKPIIQQQTPVGGNIAALSMLMMDHDVKPDMSSLIKARHSNLAECIAILEKAGFIPIVTRVSNLKTLRERILLKGPAMMLERCSLIIDDISEDLSRVRIRDPYHGWEITISGEYFSKIFQGDIIQIDKKAGDKLRVLNSFEIKAIEREIGWEAVKINCEKAIFRYHLNGSIVLEGDGKTLSVQRINGALHAYYFKGDLLYILNSRGLRMVEVLTEDQKQSLSRNSNRTVLIYPNSKGLFFIKF